MFLVSDIFYVMQGSQFHTVPTSTAGIYQSINRYKYLPCFVQIFTDEIQLFQPVNGYRLKHEMIYFFLCGNFGSFLRVEWYKSE